MSGRDRMMFTAKMKIVSSAATRKRKRENLAKPTSKALWPGVGDARGDPTKAVRVPVWTTTARAEPWWTIVPCTRSLRGSTHQVWRRRSRILALHGLTGQNGFVTLELIDTE